VFSSSWSSAWDPTGGLTAPLFLLAGGVYPFPNNLMHFHHQPFSPHTGKPSWSIALLFFYSWHTGVKTTVLITFNTANTLAPLYFSVAFICRLDLFPFHQVWPRLVQMCVIGRSSGVFSGWVLDQSPLPKNFEQKMNHFEPRIKYKSGEGHSILPRPLP